MTAPPVRVALPMLLALAACAPSGHPAGPSPRAGAHESATAVRLPPVPLIIGPLKISVVYPAATDIVELRDSAFLFGSTGNGRAAVSVNGQAARVWPNGAWIAWIAVPDDTLLNFTIEARVDSESARLDYPVRRARRFHPPVSPVWIDSASVSPAGRAWWPADEYLPISVRATEGASVRLLLPNGTSVPPGS